MSRCYLTQCAVARQGGHAARNWVHKKIPGCAVELNTQNCAWHGSQVSLITAMSFGEAMPTEPPTRGSAPGPRWGMSVPQTSCAPHLEILTAPLCRVPQQTLRYDTRCYFNVRSKADISQLNLPHLSMLAFCFDGV